ncbi:hypothetical protein KWH01_16595 [Xanthomonas campestris pv. merremiae]|uniref:hypothetical protein n=1 Tax=Xanthomonas citri TaxID=346 RepID=UPI001934327C|nr:hypothetical protein [Xanthomonas citri]MBV6838843.1 hypothetical protein [Xanthomonas campestris pv. merremiae]MCC8566226.1 hypothetical protein [Xanthomonas citri pv. fuscans]
MKTAITPRSASAHGLPPLVLPYAIVGTTDIDLTAEMFGREEGSDTVELPI